jgi:TctA family transporter
MFGELASNVALGLDVAVTPMNLFYCLLGVFLGQLLGALPGIGTLVAVTLLFPLTYHLDPIPSLIMLAGIYYGCAYGGSTASILLNIPGTPSNAVACLDGYPMAKQGRAGIALSMTTVGSFVGGSVGILLIMAFSPIIAENALRFGPWEYVALILMGLITASSVGSESPLQGIAMVVAGIILGLVGMDVNSGVPRFTFRSLQLQDGLSLVAIAIGLFGVAEVIYTVRKASTEIPERFSVTYRSMIPTREDVRRSWAPILRGSGIGSFFGALPGTGGFIASFIAYAVEFKTSRHPEEFGKGAIEGLVSPETANNAADQTNFIPTLTLGIPGSATMAIMLSILMMNGITPGPTIMTEQPQLFWGLIMSFWIGNLMLVILNIPMIGLWIKLLGIPYRLLYPGVLAFVCMGIYSIDKNVFHIWIVVAAGGISYLLRVFGLPAAPLILGFVLGPMLEEYLRRALIVAKGDFTMFLQRPLSLILLLVTLAILVSSMVSTIRKTRTKDAEASG